MAAGLRGTVVGLIITELLVGAVGPALSRGSGSSFGAMLFRVEFAFLGSAAMSFGAGHVFAAGVGGVTGYWAFLRAGGLAADAGSFLAGFGTVGRLGGLLAVFHGVVLVEDE